MIYSPSPLAVTVFGLFVALTLGLSFYFAGRTRSAQGYFAAGGSIPWFINGVAFAGDYLSAASFLGICGMIASYGYDGFLYSIGYLAGWIVALLVVAEPLKRMGRYTFADALDSRFQSRAIKLSAGISTLAVSIFYLIPQMVGAGALVKPLLGLPHWVGVSMVGAVVMLIVITAGMVSTTYVQFLKGSLLVLFSAVLTVMILNRGLTTEPTNPGYRPPRVTREVAASATGSPTADELGLSDSHVLPAEGPWQDRPYLRTRDDKTGLVTVWRKTPLSDSATVYYETQTQTTTADGRQLVNGLPHGTGQGETDFFPVGNIERLPDNASHTGPLGPIGFFSTLEQSQIMQWSKDPAKIVDDGDTTTVYYPQLTAGSDVLLPGKSPTFQGIRGDDLYAKLNFLSLMLALFGGTASLPHILIRYYTVKDQAAAQEHGGGHRHDRILLPADAVHGPGRDDQRRDRRDEFEQQHGRPAVGQEFWRVTVRHDLGDRLYHGAGNRQRIDRGGQRRGRARPAHQRGGHEADGPRKSAGRQMGGRRRGTAGDRAGDFVRANERQLSGGLGV